MTEQTVTLALMGATLLSLILMSAFWVYNLHKHTEKNRRWQSKEKRDGKIVWRSKL
jgi:hypothetical protein